MNEKTCFVIMPFSDKEKPHDNRWSDLFDNHIKPAVESAGLGYTCFRSKDPHGSFMSDIVNNLATAEITIAILTELRPNVMYELGIRHALRRKTIMLIDGVTEIPSDLADYIALKYDLDTVKGREELTKTIHERLAILDAAEQKKDNPVSIHLREVAQDVCNVWHENRNPETFLDRLRDVLPSYAFPLLPILNKVTDHINELTIRADKNAKAIEDQPGMPSPEVQKEAEAVAREGEALKRLEFEIEPSVLLNMALSAGRRGDDAAALLILDAYVELQSKAAIGWYNRAVALNRLSRYEDALSSIDNALKLDPKVAHTWDERGYALFFLRRFDEAQESFNKAFENSEDESVKTRAINNRGFALEADSKDNEALVCYEQALAINPDFAHALYNRGSVLNKLGRETEGMRSIKKALSINPDVGKEIEEQKQAVAGKNV